MHEVEENSYHLLNMMGYSVLVNHSSRESPAKKASKSHHILAYRTYRRIYLSITSQLAHYLKPQASSLSLNRATTMIPYSPLHSSQSIRSHHSKWVQNNALSKIKSKPASHFNEATPIHSNPLLRNSFPHREEENTPPPPAPHPSAVSIIPPQFVLLRSKWKS